MTHDELEQRVAALEALVHALTMALCGWHTEAERIRHTEAWGVASRDAKRQHLEADLAALDWPSGTRL